MDDHDDNRCINEDCDNPVRSLTTPIPEGAEVTWLEAVSGRARYCQPCFDRMCRRAAELLREEAAYGIGAHATPAAVLDVIEWLEGYRA